MAEELSKVKKEEIINAYAEESSLTVVPSLLEALEFRDLEKSAKYQEAKKKVIEWFGPYIDKLIRDNGVLNYLPDRVVTFVIPLDFQIPLPDNYASGGIMGPDGKSVTSANCVITFSEIIPIGNSGFKTSYACVSMCDNEIIRLMDTGVERNIMKAFDSAIQLVNIVVGGIQAIPSFHNHNMYMTTALAMSTRLHWFVVKRKNGKMLTDEFLENDNKLVMDIMTSSSLNNERLGDFKNNHVLKMFTKDKVFDLISLFRRAENNRCKGEDKQAILDADTFVEYSLGYIYYEMRVSKGDDGSVAVSDFNKLTKGGIAKIWKEFASRLEYDEEQLKVDVGFKMYDTYCRVRRNDLHHHFLANEYNGYDSMLAVYFAGRMIWELCRIVSEWSNDKILVSKLGMLGESTSFFRMMTEEYFIEHQNTLPKDLKRYVNSSHCFDGIQKC